MGQFTLSPYIDLREVHRLAPAHELAQCSLATWQRGKVGPVTAILWITAIALIVIGIAGTVLPALPGAILVFGGVALAARIDDFARIPVWLVLLFAVLTAMAWAVDYVAAAVGAKRAGASRHAIIGAAIRTVAGIFSGLWGLLFMPLVGAAIGEYLAQRERPDLPSARGVSSHARRAALSADRLQFAPTNRVLVGPSTHRCREVKDRVSRTPGKLP
jgi:hypothetical protein